MNKMEYSDPFLHLCILHDRTKTSSGHEFVPEFYTILQDRLYIRAT